MQLTNLQVLNVLQGLNILSQEKLPIKLSWKVTTALQVLQPFAKTAEEMVASIKMKYAMRDDAGNIVEVTDEKGQPIPNTITIPKEKVDIANAEFNEVFEQKIEVQNVNLKISDFPESMELSPAVLSVLSPIITEE